MHIAGENHVVTRRARVAEDVQHHLRRAPVGHPVFRVDHQRMAGPAEDLLDGLNQLDAEHRRGGDDDRRRMIQQLLLKLAQRFPIQQPRRPLEVALAAPAPRTGVEHHQRWAARQDELPLVKAQQGVDQRILRLTVHVVGSIAALGHRADHLQRLSKHIRVVTPALAQQVGDQRIADDAFGKRVAVSGFFPLRGEVPVIGDVVIIEDHQRRQMGEGAGDLAQATAKGFDAFTFGLITRHFLGAQRRHLGIQQGPGHRRPDQQVHGQHFGTGHQVVVGAAGGEHRFFHAAEKPLAQGFVALQRRQQLGALVVAGGVLVQRRAVSDHRTFKVLAKQTQAFDHLMNRPQQRPADIIGVDLIATHQQQGRALLGGRRFGQQTICAE